MLQHHIFLSSSAKKQIYKVLKYMPQVQVSGQALKNTPAPIRSLKLGHAG